jgi:outer membrane protein assembly factor BamE (lipoprotein component of BamABCDE complex)
MIIMCRGEPSVNIKFLSLSQRRVKLSLLICCCTLLFGCQAVIYGTAADMSSISIGMTKAQAIQILGQPVSVGADSDKEEEYLIYKRMKHAISAWPRTYKVTLRKGLVVKYGEQYEEKNMNLF